jgi:hypothetical protein
MEVPFMERVIVLTDGPHKLSPPSYYAFHLMAEAGVDARVTAATEEVMRVHPDMDPDDVPGIAWQRVMPDLLACLLTDAEPLTDKGEPSRVWSVPEVAKLIPVDVGARTIMLENLVLLVEDAKPAVTPGAAVPPTKRRGGAKP